MPHKKLKPDVRRVTLNGTTASSLPIADGTRTVMLIPVTTTVNVQYSFTTGLSNVAGRFGTLTAGQSLVLEPTAHQDELGAFQLELYAASAVSVDVVTLG